MEGSDDRPDCCFDEWAARNARRARSKQVAAPITQAMLAALDEAGLDGRTVLDVGCGTGDLALAALERGATRATGVDLGHGAIDNARELARQRALADRATFDVADGANAALVRSDVVVLNRVVCCYPDATGLLNNTLGAARQVFAFSAPVDRGLAGLWNRVLTRVSNVWYALRRSKFRGFRVFIHDLAAIDARVRAEGFEPVHRAHRRFVWALAVYSREGASG